MNPNQKRHLIVAAVYVLVPVVFFLIGFLAALVIS